MGLNAGIVFYMGYIGPSHFFAGNQTVSSNQTPPPDRKKLVLVALSLGFAALVMYVSFIIKTAVKGP